MGIKENDVIIGLTPFSDLNLLNEGMRYRDLATGTFLTRDPIGYADGPNVYCYVHCNPITKFDAFGLNAYLIFDITESDKGETGHVMIGVDNYDEETGAPDGSITIYHLSGDGYHEETRDKADVLSAGALVLRSTVDAVVEFETGHETDSKIVDGLEKHKKENPDYDMKNNNCGDYPKAGLEAAGKDVEGTGQEPWPLFLFTKDKDSGGSFTTPNTLYQDAVKMPGAKLTVDPGSIGDKSSTGYDEHIDDSLDTETDETGGTDED